MKKILAIAVATAIAAPAMADMTIGGTVIAGYSAADDGANETGGFGFDTAAITISGTTTTDSGLTVSASMGAGGLTRGAGDVNGENSTLKIAGDFGSVTAVAANAGSAISGVAADAENLSEEVANYGAADSDFEELTYAAPAMGGVTLSATRGEVADAAVGAGDNQTYFKYRATYAFGAASGMVDYTDYTYNTNSRLRATMSFDAGVAKLGLGYEDKDNVGTEWAAGVTVPAGALSVSAAVAHSENEAGTTERDGWSVGATYNLGGGVSVNAKTASYQATGAADATKNALLVTMAF